MTLPPEITGHEGRVIMELSRLTSSEWHTPSSCHPSSRTSCQTSLFSRHRWWTFNADTDDRLSSQNHQTERSFLLGRRSRFSFRCTFRLLPLDSSEFLALCQDKVHVLIVRQHLPD